MLTYRNRTWDLVLALDRALDRHICRLNFVYRHKRIRLVLGYANAYCLSIFANLLFTHG